MASNIITHVRAIVPLGAGSMSQRVAFNLSFSWNLSILPVMSSHLSVPKDGVASNARSPSKTVAIDIAGTPITSPAKDTVPLLKSTSGSPALKSSNSKSGSHADLHPPPSFDIEDDPKATWAQRHIVKPLHNKFVIPMINIMKSGATPEGIALSLAFGLTGGVFPVPATTTVMCVIFVFLFKLNFAAVQLTNLLMTPINLATFMTFIRYGEALFGVEPVPLSLEPFKTEPLQALATFWVSLCYGIVAWAIFTPPATYIAYSALKPVMRKAMASMFQKPD